MKIIANRSIANGTNDRFGYIDLKKQQTAQSCVNIDIHH